VLSNQGASSPFRLLWYVAHTLYMAGGGERLIMEGLRQFELRGLEATLLLGIPMPNQAALFGGTYKPSIQILDGQVSGQSNRSRTIWQKAIGRLRQPLHRARSLATALLSSEPTLVIATSPDDCRKLWLARLLSLRRLPIHITFIHGSPFQFSEEATKYSMVFRRHLNEIRDADPVYSQMISPRRPAMSLKERVRLERDCLFNYLAVRLSGYILVHTQKNRREVELLYNHRNVVVVPAGGFSQTEFACRDYEDMKAAFNLGDKKVVLSVCRLVAKKRVDLAIRAFAEMARHHAESNTIMVVGGTGPAEDYLRALCRELQIEDRVMFIGFVPESQLKDWYYSCNVFVSTDNADYDLSVMMALPLACKVLVTEQYDFPDCLDKMRRYIHVAEPSGRGLADAMHEAIQSAPAPLDATDLAELNNLTWEHYFGTILSLGEKSLYTDRIRN
jgi:glycosyltransferase involved in cell wall biosynthesis